MAELARLIASNSWTPAAFRYQHRCNANWLCADFVALDFDNSMHLEDARKIFCDMTCVIGTSINHQREKNGVVCDRFRVVLKLTERCKSVDDYRYTVQQLVKRHDADWKSHDPAHYFRACREIVCVNEAGYTEDIQPETPYARHMRMVQVARSTGPLLKISCRAENFLKTGQIFDDGRNCTIRDISRDLYRAGWGIDKIVEEISKAPFDRQGFCGRGDDIRRIAMNSAKYVERMRHGK